MTAKPGLARKILGGTEKKLINRYNQGTKNKMAERKLKLKKTRGTMSRLSRAGNGVNKKKLSLTDRKLI